MGWHGPVTSRGEILVFNSVAERNVAWEQWVVRSL